MALIPINKAGDIGLVTDQPYNELPLNAWTGAQNVRFKNGAVEKFAGHIEVFPGALNPPYFLLGSAYAANFFWMYPGITKVGATDGITHVDITRAVGGDYGMDLDTGGWTGGVIEDIPVINNAIDVPQMWRYPDITQKLEDLANWPAATTARALRVFKRYLVALDITKGITRYPNMIKWSHQAPQGDIPASWDETDETIDAGEYSLPTEGGSLMDLKTLRDDAILYKELQTWKMQYVGGTAIFRFTKLFDSIGTIARKCATEFLPGKHFVFTGDDCIVHDGQSGQSVIEEWVKDLLAQTLDQSMISRCFTVSDFNAKEVWTGLPESGQLTATKALVWNWIKNKWSIRTLPAISYAESGIVSISTDADTWDGDATAWEDDLTSWGERSFNPSGRGLLMASPLTSKLYKADMTTQFAGTEIQAYVERQGLGFPLKVNEPPDYTTVKQVQKVWPRITGTQGGQIKVYLGIQKKINDPVTYLSPRIFTIGTTEFLDFTSSPSSRLHALKFESVTNIDWKLHAYDVEVVNRGNLGG